MTLYNNIPVRVLSLSPMSYESEKVTRLKPKIAVYRKLSFKELREYYWGYQHIMVCFCLSEAL